jgi:hypothetical protein
VDDEDLLLDEHTLRPLNITHHFGLDSEGNISSDYTFVVTGDVFRWMLNQSEFETLQKVSCWKRRHGGHDLILVRCW